MHKSPAQAAPATPSTDPRSSKRAAAVQEARDVNAQLAVLEERKGLLEQAKCVLEARLLEARVEMQSDPADARGTKT